MTILQHQLHYYLGNHAFVIILHEGLHTCLNSTWRQKDLTQFYISAHACHTFAWKHEHLSQFYLATNTLHFFSQFQSNTNNLVTVLSRHKHTCHYSLSAQTSLLQYYGGTNTFVTVLTNKNKKKLLSQFCRLVSLFVTILTQYTHFCHSFNLIQILLS